MGVDAMTWYRLGRRLRGFGVPLVSRLLGKVASSLHSSHVPCEAEIGEGTRVGHGGIGVVIHPAARVGRHCVIARQVTIGSQTGADGAPVIGDYVRIGAGAKVLGKVRVGDFAVIGANAVVLKDVAPGAVVSGIPAVEVRRDPDPVASWTRETGCPPPGLFAGSAAAPKGTVWPDGAGLKVLLVGDFPPPHGGVAVHVGQLMRAFNAAGATARVLDVGKGPMDKGPGVFRVRRPAELVLHLARFSAGGWLIHLHVSGNNTRAFLLAAAAGLVIRPAAGRVITLHSGLLPAFLTGGSARQVLAYTALREYERIVAVSDAVRDAVVALGVPAERVLVHPAFCASQVVGVEAPPALGAILRRRSPMLAYAHHPSRIYGRATLFDALARLRPSMPHLGLAMFGVESGAPEVREDARRAGVQDLIEDLGELSHAEALAVIERAAVFVRPTLADGDAISVREALALGTPCVASDAAARPPGTIVFRAGNAEDLAARLTEALEGPRHVVRGPDAVPFLLQLYRSLLENTAGPEAGTGAWREIRSDAGRELPQ